MTTATTEKATEKKTKILVDPELAAMSRIERLLRELDAEARRRVLNWLASKFTPLMEVQLRSAAQAENGGRSLGDLYTNAEAAKNIPARK